MVGCHICSSESSLNIIVLNVHAPSEDNSDDSKDGFSEELGQFFYNFPNYRMKIY